MVEPSSDRNIRIEKSAVGSAIVSGDGNTIYVIHQGIEPQDEPTDETEGDVAIGPNPYKGLAAFQAKDAANYFGREAQVERLWQRFQDLYEQSGRPDSKPRFLPILGPSGCGKSSLARAGLVPELARRPLPGKEKMRVVVMVPGASPVKSLAGVLAKLTQDDKTPEVIKKRRYEEELRKSAASGRFDFWQDVAETLLDVQSVPVVVLVDQFEELYSLCEDAAEREAFVENLLYAAHSATGYVSVVVTLRSDFLGETQRHKVLNQLIGSDLSMIVPAMTEAELRRAIALPAKQAGHPLDAATVDLLVNDAEGREGALPLLQFALTRIWEGLKEGKSPSETYREMNGVGGALAKKAQDIYDSLSVNEQEIARRVFLGLVQLGEGVRDTRRRAAVENLATSRDTPDVVKQVVSRFSAPGARLVSLSSEASKETAEVTHEALFDHWQLLNDWLDSSREDIRFQRRLEEDAVYWDEQGKPNGLLWRSPDLDLLRKFEKKSQGELSSLSFEFFQAADTAEKREKRVKRLGVAGLAAGLLISTTLSLFSTYKVHQAARRQMELYESRAKDLADSNDVESLVNGLAAIGLGRSPFVKFPNIFSEALVTTAILDEPNRTMRATHVASQAGYRQLVATNADGTVLATIASESEGPFNKSESTLSIRDATGKVLSSTVVPFPDVAKLAISADGNTVVCGNSDGLLQIWDSEGNPLSEPFEAHSARLGSVAIDADGSSIVSSSGDETIRLWDREGKLIKTFSLEGSGLITEVDISPDGQTIYVAKIRSDSRLQSLDREGNIITEFSEKEAVNPITALSVSADNQTIVSGSNDAAIRVWSTKGELVGGPFFPGYVGPISDVDITADGQSILTSSGGSAKLWNRQGDSIDIVANSSVPVVSSAMSDDGKTIITANNERGFENPDGNEGVLKIWHASEASLFQKFEVPSRQALSVSVDAQGKTVAVVGQDKAVWLLNAQGQLIEDSFRIPGERNFSVALSMDGKTISVVDRDIQKFSRKGELVDTWEKVSSSPSSSLSVSADGETIVRIQRESRREGKIQIFDSKERLLGSSSFIVKGDGYVRAETISADGQAILVIEQESLVSEEATIKILNRSGQIINTPFEMTELPRSGMLMSADGKTLLMKKTEFSDIDEQNEDSEKEEEGSYSMIIESESIQLLNINGNYIGEPFAEIEGAIRAVAISSDGKSIATSYNNGDIQLWDREGNRIGTPLQGHAAAVNFLEFSLDGKTIVSTGYDGTVRLWPVWLSEGWVSYTCDRLANYLPEASKTSDVAREAKRTCDHYAKK
ncbi:MAG: hypothetical protein AAFQ95_05780 [Cyanobacteria bacterium J06621_3]